MRALGKVSIAVFLTIAASPLFAEMVTYTYRGEEDSVKFDHPDVSYFSDRIFFGGLRYSYPTNPRLHFHILPTEGGSLSRIQVSGDFSYALILSDEQPNLTHPGFDFSVIVGISAIQIGAAGPSTEFGEETRPFAFANLINSQGVWEVGIPAEGHSGGDIIPTERIALGPVLKALRLRRMGDSLIWEYSAAGSEFATIRTYNWYDYFFERSMSDCALTFGISVGDMETTEANGIFVDQIDVAYEVPVSQIPSQVAAETATRILEDFLSTYQPNDVNFDGEINAIDIQQVINAVLNMAE